VLSCCLWLYALLGDGRLALIASLSLLLVTFAVLGYLGYRGTSVDPPLLNFLIFATATGVDAIGHVASIIAQVGLLQAPKAMALVSWPVTLSIGLSVIVFLPMAFGNLPTMIDGALLMYTAWLLSFLFAMLFLPAAAMLWARAAGGCRRPRRNVRKYELATSISPVPSREPSVRAGHFGISLSESSRRSESSVRSESSGSSTALSRTSSESRGLTGRGAQAALESSSLVEMAAADADEGSTAPA